jgi:hypothetical protein
VAAGVRWAENGGGGVRCGWVESGWVGRGAEAKGKTLACVEADFTDLLNPGVLYPPLQLTSLCECEVALGACAYMDAFTMSSARAWHATPVCVHARTHTKHAEDRVPRRW